jgi:predicted RNase H-like HicB family nuclease
VLTALAYETVVPALTDCVTDGRTIEHALAMAQELDEIRLVEMIDSGEEIPGDTEA